MEGLPGIELAREKVESKYISKKGNTIYLLCQYLGESRDVTKLYFYNCLHLVIELNFDRLLEFHHRIKPGGTYF